MRKNNYFIWYQQDRDGNLAFSECVIGDAPPHLYW